MSTPSLSGLSGVTYLRLVLLGALIGIPAALVAALFLALVHELTVASAWITTAFLGRRS